MQPKFVATLILAVALVCHVSIIAGQSKEVDRYIRGWMEKRHIPGVSLIVIKNGKVVKASSYGVANVELNVPVNSKTSFEIASMTKQFTAAAFLQLVEEGKVSLDDRVTKYFDNLPSTWSRITLRQLMDHTSGLGDDWDENNNYFLTKSSNDEFLNAIKLAPLKFATGERYGYSCGPFIVGMIIEKVSGKSYARFMEQRIFQPLGMTSTFVNGSRTIVADHASGYVYRDGKLMAGAVISRAAHARADVGITTTSLDLAKWDAAMRDTRLLKQTSLNEMFSPARTNDGSTTLSGLGWWLNPVRGRSATTHGGGFRTGFNSTINRYLDDELTVIVLTNLFRAGANDAGHTVASFYDPAYRPVASMNALRDPRPGRTADLKDQLIRLSNGETKIEKFSNGFPYHAYEPEDWKQLIKGMRSILFKRCQATARNLIGFPGVSVSDICFYKIVAGDESRIVSITFDTNGNLVYIEPYEY